MRPYFTINYISMYITSRSSKYSLVGLFSTIFSVYFDLNIESTLSFYTYILELHNKNCDNLSNNNNNNRCVIATADASGIV